MGLGTPVRRRSRDSGCQWLTIGMALGAGCSLVFFLMSYVIGFVEISGLENDAPTAVIEVGIVTAQVTSTLPPAAAQPIEPETDMETDGTTDASTDNSDVDSMASDEDVASATESVDAAAQPDDAGTVDDNAPTFTPSPTMLGSSAQNAPTALPEAGAGGEASDAASAPEIGTPVPLDSVPTEVPEIGSQADIPDTLQTIASPMVTIDSGTFTMGTTREEGLLAVDECINRDGGICSESYIQDATPAHQVTLDGFQIEIYEVSINQFITFLNELAANAPGVRADLIGCGGQPCALAQSEEPNSVIRYNQETQQYELVNPEFHTNHPANFVTWYGADAYCKSLGRRLPTEAEWERAARGPANSVYPWGPEWIPANANTSRSGTNGQGTEAVDAYIGGVNPYGLYNMAGNVSEWVLDFYLENYYSNPAASQPNPQGPPVGELRVARGGGWDNVPLFSRAVHRIAVDPKEPRASLGFRCAADTQ